MPKNKKDTISIFKILSLIALVWSSADAYLLVKDESLSQLLWFCNAVVFLLAFGLYFESAIVLTAVLVGALVVQLPWLLDFFIKLFFGHYLFGVTSYMFDYGLFNIRLYAELDHLMIIPFSIYGVKKLGLHKNGWIIGTAVAIIINGGAYVFSSYKDNINCVFYSCLNQKITISPYPFAYMVLWTALISVLMFALNRVIYEILKRKIRTKY